MLSHTTVTVAPQDHAASLKEDPTQVPCKSALGTDMVSNFNDASHDGAAVAFKVSLLPVAASAAETGVPASPIQVPQNGSGDSAARVASGVSAAQEAEFAVSKEASDMEYAVNWLRSNPVIHARVLEVFRKYDAKHYRRSSASNVPFWRDVMCDLVGKAGQSHDSAKSTDDTTTTTTTANDVVTAQPSNIPEGWEEDDGFFVIDLARVVVQMAKWRRYLPRFQPHYAMKCNNTEPIVSMISALGGSYDCASKGEFNAVLDGGFQTAENIIFAHPCKMINNITAANARGVYLTTFDNEEELEKLHKHMPKAQAVLRIATDDSAAVCAFSSKFGCPVDQTPGLLDRARELGVNVVGVSFHVGSGNSSFQAYHKAITDARKIFDYGAEIGFEMDLLDIGGGFPGSDVDVDPETGKRPTNLFEDVANFIRNLTDELFPASSGVRLIGEPGRYFAESPYAIAMAIHSKRKIVKKDGTAEWQYYTSDGKYQCFNCMIYDHAHPKVCVLRPDPEAPIRTTTIFGPTCDSIDWIMRQEQFPALDIGDWIFVPNFGAYTVAAGSAFNGFSTKRIEYISSLDVFAQ